MSNVKYRVGIMGGGVVGKAVASFFRDAKIYDKFNQQDSLEDVLDQDIVFVCVPTPYDQEKGFDRSFLEDVFENLAKDGKERIVVIKSTSVPGTTKFFQEKYPQLKVLFNPEFLTEKTAEQDFLNPDKQIVGYTENSKQVAEDVLSILPDAPYKKIMPSEAAELVKYAINSFYATKVIFGNMLYDLCEALGVQYSDVKDAFVSDRRICDSHFEVMHGGYRGYGGKCLPKDLKSLKDQGSKLGVGVEILEAVDKMNDKYRSS